MPTGYTEEIERGKMTTLREYAWRAARAFLMRMREDPTGATIPTNAKPDLRYYEPELRKARAAQQRFERMTIEEARVERNAELAVSISDRHAYRERVIEHNMRYQAMLDQVEAWQPPDALAGLKKFMIEQINVSMYTVPDAPDPDPKPIQSLDEWMADRLDACVRDIKRLEEHIAKEHAYVDAQNAWVRDLVESVGPQHIDTANPGSRCQRPPAGWWCSRPAGHTGPCPTRAGFGPEDM